MCLSNLKLSTNYNNNYRRSNNKTADATCETLLPFKEIYDPVLYILFDKHCLSKPLLLDKKIGRKMFCTVIRVMK